MVKIPVNLTGSSATYRSRAQSAQVTRNLFPMFIDDNASVKSRYILDSFVGQSAFFSDATFGVGRGLAVYKETMYRVAGSSLYSVSASGVHTSLGTIAGTAQCTFTSAVDGLIIANGQGRVYRYTGSVFSEITDSDLETPNSAAFINAKTIYDGTSGRFSVSDVGDSTSIGALNFGTAESNVDDLVRGYVFNQRYYAFGTETIETFWDSPAALNPPLVRVEGSILQVGLHAFYSLSSNDTSMFFLADDQKVYALGAGLVRVSTDILDYIISTYSKTDDAIGWCMTLRGQNYYVLTFPTANKTWVLPEGGEWFEWSSGVTGGRNRANSYVFCYNKHYVESNVNGDIYELDWDVYTETGSTIVRQRDTGTFHGGLLPMGRGATAAGMEFEIKQFELLMETRVGELSGEGHDPQIILQLSYDGGRTFGNEYIGYIGNTNQDFIKVYWYGLGRGHEVVFRIKVTDPVYVSIHSAIIDAEAIR
jgi:hypothetical protein